MQTTHLIEELVVGNCLKYGNFKLKSGAISNYYIDLREAVFYPKLFNMLVDEIVSRIRALIGSYPMGKVAIVGVPYGVWLLTGAVIRDLGCASAPLRKEVKSYGNTIDMSVLKDHRIIIIEDVMSSGSSIMETIEKLDGMNVTDVVVVVNRELGGEENLQAGYPKIKLHSIIRASDIRTQIPHNAN